ncbi:MAG: MBL fold metallo-hydrolase [Clostridium sp.]|uniref:MBL fold metallo-hydrolase n=1 Tax=Clostridium sp. TaxID=1506 RepID=UPI003F30FF9B
MDITWLCNSTFLIKNSIGKRILIDPLNRLFSHNIDNIKPNIITISNFSSDSFSLPEIDSSTTLITSSGHYNSDFCRITGYDTFSDHFNGAKRGGNIVYVYEIDNLRLCHLGYLGEVLSDDLVKKLGKIDILFIPVGGHISLSGIEAFKLCKKLNPNIIIPMNYKYSSSAFMFNGIHDFLLLLKNSCKVTTDSYRISKDTLLANGAAIILKPMKLT